MAPPKDHRCAVCRRRFLPAPAHCAAQVLCGELACRRARDNALARRRRARDVVEAREDEALRQRKCRQARRDAALDRAARAAPTSERAAEGPSGDAAAPRCHAPPSDANLLESLTKSVQSWALRDALSRATLQREIATIQADLARHSGQSGYDGAALSRATLPAREPVIQGVSG